jgi:hypothetical protein
MRPAREHLLALPGGETLTLRRTGPKRWDIVASNLLPYGSNPPHNHSDEDALCFEEWPDDAINLDTESDFWDIWRKSDAVQIGSVKMTLGGGFTDDSLGSVSGPSLKAICAALSRVEINSICVADI